MKLKEAFTGMSFLASPKEALEFIKKNPAIIYSLALIVILPLFLMFYTYFVTTTFSNAFNDELHRKALAVGGLVEVFGGAISEDAAPLSKRLERLRDNLPDIANVSVALPTSTPGTFRVIASSEPADIGQDVGNFGYILAWQQKQAIAAQVRVKGADAGRQWQVIQPLRDDAGKTVALATVLLDQQVARQALSRVLTVSYLALLVFVLIVVLLVGNNTRLFERARLFQELKEVDRLKDEFIGIASHELRTPIGAVKGYLSMALDGTYGRITQKLRSGLTVAFQSTEHLAGLIEDILEVSRIEQGRIDLEPSLVKPASAAKAVIAELQVSAKRKGLALIFNDHGPVPDIFVDPDRIRQVLINLIGNSVKYTNKGTVGLTVDQDKKGSVRFVIEDTGIGIPAEEQQKLFEKFHRVKSAETAKIRGTGLGLWITKRLVELMAGQIFVESIAGQGSRFSVVFPAADLAKK